MTDHPGITIIAPSGHLTIHTGLDPQDPEFAVRCRQLLRLADVKLADGSFHHLQRWRLTRRERITRWLRSLWRVR